MSDERVDPSITRYPHPINLEALSVSPEKKKNLIAQKMKEILEILGLDLSSPSILETPKRIATMYVDEIFCGLDSKNFPDITFYEEIIPEEAVLIKNVSLISFCEHHFVPMIGTAHVSYLPAKKLLGFSKINRIVRYFGARPQLQERLTGQIADSLCTLLETEDIAVAIHMKHFCVIARGVEDSISEAETTVLKGKFQTDSSLRSEFFSRIKLEEPSKESIISTKT